MTANKAIISALTTLVNGNIWALSKPATKDPDEFITFNPEVEYLDYGDNRDQDGEMSYQIHWFKKGQANYLNQWKNIRKALREADFVVEPSPYVTYESANGSSVTGSATGWTHMTISARYEEDEYFPAPTGASGRS